MMDWQTFLVGFGCGLALAGLLVALAALREVRELERNPSLPYKVRNGIEDLSVPLIKSLMAIEREKAFLDNQERELGVFLKIAGEIRSGKYDPDQPHKER